MLVSAVADSADEFLRALQRIYGDSAAKLCGAPDK
jgi:hypothetical protein